MDWGGAPDGADRSRRSRPGRGIVSSVGPPSFVRLEVNRRALVSGGRVLVSWETTAAQEVEVVGVGIFAACGSAAVALRRSGRVRLIAHGPGGRTDASTPVIHLVDLPELAVLGKPVPLAVIDLATGPPVVRLDDGRLPELVDRVLDRLPQPALPIPQLPSPPAVSFEQPAAKATRRPRRFRRGGR
jgi:hypothetical protein